MIATGLALVLGGCPSGDRKGTSTTGGVSAALDGGKAASLASPALRCSECHEALYDEWKQSPHARSASSPLYASMRKAMSTSPKTTVAKESCDGCHAPLVSLLEEGDLAAKEGVTCDACHAIKEVVSQGGRGVNVLALDDNRKRGRRCDLKDHYFHKMGCAPFFHDGEVCSGCHRLTEHASGGDVPIFTEFDDWKSGPSGRTGVPCQDCHMPGDKRELATGAGMRGDVATHGFFGLDGELRKHALSLAMSAKSDGDKVAATVTLKNERAGHPVPEGLPGRQIVLRVTLADDAGAELDRGEVILTRELVNEHGEEVPFYAATAQGSDKRLAAGASKTSTFSFAPPRTLLRGAIDAKLFWRALSPKIALAIGAEKPEEQELATAHVAFGAPGPSGARKGLPASTRVGP